MIRLFKILYRKWLLKQLVLVTIQLKSGETISFFAYPDAELLGKGITPTRSILNDTV